MSENYEGALRREKEKKVILRILNTCLKKVGKGKGSFSKKKLTAHQLSFKANNHLFELSKVLVPSEWLYHVLSVGDHFLQRGMVTIARRQFFEKIHFEMTLIDYVYPNGEDVYIKQYVDLQLDICSFFEAYRRDANFHCEEATVEELGMILSSVFKKLDVSSKKKRKENKLCVWTVFQQTVSVNLMPMIEKLVHIARYGKAISFLEKSLVFVEDVINGENDNLNENKVNHLFEFYLEAASLLWMCFINTGVEVKELRAFTAKIEQRVHDWSVTKKIEVEADPQPAPTLMINASSGELSVDSTASKTLLIPDAPKVEQKVMKEIDISNVFKKMMYAKIVEMLDQRKEMLSSVESSYKQLIVTGKEKKGSEKREKVDAADGERPKTSESIGRPNTGSTVGASRFGSGSALEDSLNNCLMSFEFYTRGNSIFSKLPKKKVKKSDSEPQSVSSGMKAEMGIVNEMFSVIMQRIAPHLCLYEEDFKIGSKSPGTSSPIKKKKKKKKGNEETGKSIDSGKKKKKKKSPLRENDRYKEELPGDIIFGILRYAFYFENVDVVTRLAPIVTNLFPTAYETLAINFLLKYPPKVPVVPQSVKPGKAGKSSTIEENQSIEEENVVPVALEIIKVFESIEQVILGVRGNSAALHPLQEQPFSECLFRLVETIREYIPKFEDLEKEVLLSMFYPISCLKTRFRVMEVLSEIGFILMYRLENSKEYAQCLTIIEFLLTAVVRLREAKLFSTKNKHFSSFVASDQIFEDLYLQHTTISNFYYRLSVKHFLQIKKKTVVQSINQRIDVLKTKENMQDVFGKPCKKERTMMASLNRRMKNVKITNIGQAVQQLKKECGINLYQLALLNISTVPFKTSKSDRKRVIDETIKIVAETKKREIEFVKNNSQTHVIQLLKSSENSFQMKINPKIKRENLSDELVMIFGKEKTLQDPLRPLRTQSRTPVTLNDMNLLGTGITLKKDEIFYVEGLVRNKFYVFQLVGIEVETGLVSGGMVKQDLFSFSSVLPLPIALIECKLVEMTFRYKFFKECFTCIKSIVSSFDFEKIVALKKEDETVVEAVVESAVKEKKKKSAKKKKSSRKSSRKESVEPEVEVIVVKNKSLKYIETVFPKKVFKEILKVFEIAKKLRLKEARVFLKSEGTQILISKIKEILGDQQIKQDSQTQVTKN